MNNSFLSGFIAGLIPLFGSIVCATNDAFDSASRSIHRMQGDYSTTGMFVGFISQLILLTGFLVVRYFFNL